jgi:hypothetical protein
MCNRVLCYGCFVVFVWRLLAGGAPKLTQGLPRGTGSYTTTTQHTMPSIVAPISELKLRTDFILDRFKAMDCIVDAIHTESEPASMALLDLLLKDNYLTIIARHMMPDTEPKMRAQATNTMANLMGADRADVCMAANKVCLEIQSQVFDTLRNPPDAICQAYTAYLLFNWARRFGENDDVDEELLSLLDDGFVSTIKRASTRNDLLVAITAALRRSRAGRKVAREVVKMLMSATSKKEQALLLDAFGEICSEEGSSFAAEDHAAVFDLFEQLLGSDLNKGQRCDVTWALSNFVCDGNLGDKFFTRTELRNDMILQCEDVDVRLREEACWVLVNAIAGASWESTQADVSADHGLRYAICAVEAACKDDGQLFIAIHEALDTLSEWEALYTPLEESDAETELLEEEEYDDEFEEEDEDDGCFCAEEVVVPPQPPVQATEAPLPSALELLVTSTDRNGGTMLRGLIHSLKEAGANSWVPVPAGTMFSIEDLTLMGSLGYTISNGYFGINPYLAAVRYF